MSKKSSARTGSEGDADSRFGEVFPNAGSRSSSYKSKKGIEAGPYGDSPSDRQTYKDCFFYMLQENDSTDSSGEEDSPELYSLRNDYLEKLNALRKRLNLIELNDDDISKNNRGCTITEIIEEEPEHSRTESHKESTSSEKKELCSNSTQESENLEIKTLHPFSVCYNFEAQSITNILELEYNPPKKKSCFRLRTPKLPSASESNLPYHTKVSLREDLFKKLSDEVPEAKNSAAITKECYDKFTRTQETQVEENDIDSEAEEESSTGESSECRNVNLFPTVIVASEPPKCYKDTSVSARSSLEAVSCRVASDQAPEEQKEPEGYPLNFAGDSSSYNTVTTSTTIVDTPKTETKKLRKRLSLRTKKSSNNQLSMWDELNRVKKKNEEGQGEGASLKPLKDVISDQKRAGQSLNQYLSYRKERRRAKSSPIKRKKCLVPYGPVLLHESDREQNLDTRYYLFNSSSPSEEERYLSEIYAGKYGSGSSSTEGGTFWSRLIGCFRPVFSFIARR